MAEHEIQEKSSRTKRYAQERHQKGHPKPGSTPHGYRWVIAQNRGEDDSRFVVDVDEASDVQFIFDEFLSGTTLYQIAAALNREGRRTRSGGEVVCKLDAATAYESSLRCVVTTVVGWKG
ncbi:hypothetical protein FYJ24_00660 [Actinomycetaceae bacterium WB03_NA08]|uniref:Uncharacterized protein n=1 Tax=Scrofimicrobium canadense TaxID=2652290 RepID=A0A6N7VNK8_9ACTO|nr:hypothetical protein [Scrofimicrobium canadense]MSS83299.1 hypothetical protein [Scrofimicrobium canadense]